MGGIFSRKRSANGPVQNCEITEHDQAILQLKTQRDKIKQFIKRKEKCLEKERELAKKLIHDGRKDKALLLLKKKRYQENIIDQTVKQLDQIDKMVQDLEFAEIQQKVVDGLRQGNEALKKMNAIFDVDEVERIMDETKEAAQYQDEIASMISGQLSNTDISEVEQELDDLLAAEIADKLPDAADTTLPEQQEPVAEKTAPQKKTERVALEAQ